MQGQSEATSVVHIVISNHYSLQDNYNMYVCMYASTYVFMCLVTHVLKQKSPGYRKI